MLFRAEEMAGEPEVNDLIQMTFDEFSHDEQITMQEFCMRFCFNIIQINKRYQSVAMQCEEITEKLHKLIEGTTIQGLSWSYLKHFANHYSFENSALYVSANQASHFFLCLEIID